MAQVGVAASIRLRRHLKRRLQRAVSQQKRRFVDKKVNLVCLRPPTDAALHEA